MGAPRKVFRIEEMSGVPRAALDEMAAPSHADIMQELRALHARLAEASPLTAGAPALLRRNDIEWLADRLRLIRATITGVQNETAGRGGAQAQACEGTRIAHELEAVMKGSEQATEKILAAAEDIDQAANTLSAVLRSESQQGLAQDIRDRVIAIFEACNFQDITCQRVTKVMATLGHIELLLARTLDELTRSAAPPLHGPPLEGDRGYASQSDVDLLFGEDVQDWSSESAA